MTRTEADLTKRRLHSKPFGRSIELCPQCGRKGERAIYRDGDRLFSHKKHTYGMFWDVTDSCYIRGEISAN